MGSVIALVNDLAVLASSVLADVPAPGGIEQGPEPEDVKAGWTAFAIFFGLCGVVALLCWSFVHRIRNARRARDEGVYGDPVAEPEERPAATTEDRSA